MTEKQNNDIEAQVSQPIVHEGAAAAALLTDDVLQALATNLSESISSSFSEEKIRDEVRQELTATLHSTPEEVRMVRERIEHQKEENRLIKQEIIDEAKSLAPTGQLLVVTVGDKVAAMGGYDCIGNLPDNPEVPVYKLCRVSVLPEFQKLKLGSLLMDQRIDAIEKRHAQAVISVVTKSEQIVGMLERRKFEKVTLEKYWRTTGWPEEEIVASTDMIKAMEANGMNAFLRIPPSIQAA